MGISRNRIRMCVCAAGMLAGLVACDENGQFLLSEQPQAGSASDVAPTQGSVKTVERDVEAPDVFSVTEAGLWDGRPSLGGVWVAHPDVDEPERVIIRNTGNGKFVVGALFRREREIPGPRLQISSDAATSLGMLAGSPGELNVTALRREEVPSEVPAPAAAPVEAETIAEPTAVAEAPLDAAVDPVEVDPIESAAAAIEAAPEPEEPKKPWWQRLRKQPAEPETAVAAADVPGVTSEALPSAQPAQAPNAPVVAAAPAAPAPKPRPVASSLSKPYIQVGIFSVKGNADRTAAQMRSAGMLPTVREGSTGGKAFWRVIVGPAGNSADRKQILAKIKEVGFTDAYPVTN